MELVPAICDKRPYRAGSNICEYRGPGGFGAGEMGEGPIYFFGRLFTAYGEFTGEEFLRVAEWMCTLARGICYGLLNGSRLCG